MMGYTVPAVQISANRRTAFLLAQALSLSLRALATRTSWPHSSKTLLAQGEWVPASIAMRMGCS